MSKTLEFDDIDAIMAQALTIVTGAVELEETVMDGDGSGCTSCPCSCCTSCTNSTQYGSWQCSSITCST
jgi:hypothetical protein